MPPSRAAETGKTVTALLPRDIPYLLLQEGESLMKIQISGCFLLAGILAVLLMAPAAMQAQQVAATPPMGWNSWNYFNSKIDDATVRAVRSPINED